MIEELSLENFKSFGAGQTIRFTQGVNKISGRNAAGKTTILEAILFALFGDVPGVNKKDLVSLKGGTLAVTLKFWSPLTHQHVTVLRSGTLDKDQKFVSKELRMTVIGEGAPFTREADVNSKIKELLGIGRRTFFNVVYAKQKEFVEILNPEKGRMDAILGLTTPTEIVEQLKTVKKTIEKDGRIDQKGAVEERLRITLARQKEEEANAQKLGEEILQLKARLEDARKRVTEKEGKMRGLDDLSKTFREMEQKNLQLEVLKGRRRDREKDLLDIYTRLGESPESKLVELEERKAKSIELENRLREILEKQLEVERRTLDGEIASLKHRINEHGELKDAGIAICPKCGQHVDPEKLEEDLRAYRGEMEEKAFRLKDLEKEIGAVKQQIEASRGKRIDAERTLAKFLGEMDQVEKLKEATKTLFEEYKGIQDKLTSEETLLKTRAEKGLEKSFSSLSDAKTYLDDVKAKEQKDLTLLQADLRSSAALVEDRQRQIDRARKATEEYRRLAEDAQKLLFSIKEFESKIQTIDRMEQRYAEYEKRMRETILKQLGWLTFNYFQRLTDQQLYNRCSIDAENYSLQVIPIDSQRPIAAWRCGGGHESLFALSERLAIMRVMGFSHLLILDEPTDAVDSENIPSLLEYISKSTSEIGQIILVTHHGYGEEEKMNNIFVNKIAGESRIQQD